MMPAAEDEVEPSAVRKPETGRAWVTIRRLQPDDRDAMRNLLRPQQIDARLVQQRRAEGVFLIAWATETPAGHVFVRWDPGDPVAGLVEKAVLVEQLGVVAARRRQGIGSALLDAAERIAEVSGYGAAALAVGVDNADAERLYRRHGYRPLNVSERYLSWTTWDAEGRPLTEGEWVRYLAKPL